MASVIKIRPMNKRVSRKDFLKLGALALTSLAANSFPPTADDAARPSGEIRPDNQGYGERVQGTYLANR